MLVRSRPRIHIALADMGFATERSYGGVGFAFDGPQVVWEVSASSTFSFDGIDGLDKSAVDAVASVAALMEKLTTGRGVHAKLVSTPPQHSGYGTKTCLLLSLIAVTNERLSLGLSRAEMQALAGRGAASGIGSATFFDGGVVWDGGHPRRHIGQLLPSSAIRNESPPPVIARWQFPAQWQLISILPQELGLSGQDEIDFFNDHTPIPRSECLETIAQLCHGVIPAFQFVDLELMATSLRALHATGFKRLEVAARSTKCQSVLENFHAAGLAAGLSSTGPLMYVITEKGFNASDLIELVGDMPFSNLDVFDGYNRGYSIEEIHG